MRYSFLFFLLSGIIYAQSQEELKETLVDMTVRWHQVVEVNKQLNNDVLRLINDLNAIPEPSDTLIAILKKYKIYGNISSKNTESSGDGQRHNRPK